MSDGGEGLIDTLLGSGFEEMWADATDPLRNPVRARWAKRDDTAVVELAEASGLRFTEKVKSAEVAKQASTFGTGQLFKSALDSGATHLIVGIGGSATTDGGSGMLGALGARYWDYSDTELDAKVSPLSKLARVDFSGIDSRIRDLKLEFASDVDNPLTGPDGSAAVFGPQKGLTPEVVGEVDGWLQAWAALVQEETGVDAASWPGAGAAGGAGFALYSLGARGRKGIDLVLDEIGLDDALRQAKLVVIGEGKLDSQTLHGKAPAGVAARAKQQGVPIVAVAGVIELSEDELTDFGISKAYALSDLEPDLGECVSNPRPLLVQIGKLIGQEFGG